MHILICDRKGEWYSVKRSDIRRVSVQGTIGTVVRFTNTKRSTTIYVLETVPEFHNKYLRTK